MYCSASFTNIHTFIILFDLVQTVFSILHGANAWYYCMRIVQQGMYFQNLKKDKNGPNSFVMHHINLKLFIYNSHKSLHVMCDFQPKCIYETEIMTIYGIFTKCVSSFSNNIK